MHCEKTYECPSSRDRLHTAATRLRVLHLGYHTHAGRGGASVPHLQTCSHLVVLRCYTNFAHDDAQCDENSAFSAPPMACCCAPRCAVESVTGSVFQQHWKHTASRRWHSRRGSVAAA